MRAFLRTQKEFPEQAVFVFSSNDSKIKKQLEWEGDDEFRFRGEMYDVIEKKTINGKVIIRCISDKKETLLIERYKKMNGENNSRSKSALLIKLVDSTYLATTDSELCAEYVPSPLAIHFQYVIIPSRTIEVITPPPQA